MEQKRWHWHWHWNFSGRRKDFSPPDIQSPQCFCESPGITPLNTREESPQLLLLDLLMEAPGTWAQGRLPVSTVAGGLQETGSSAMVTRVVTALFLQLFSACQTPLPCCGGNWGCDPSAPAWLCLHPSTSAVPRILPDLSWKQLLWLSVPTPLSTGDSIESVSHYSWQEPGDARGLWQAQKLPFPFLSFCCDYEHSWPPKTSHHQLGQRDTTGVLAHQLCGRCLAWLSQDYYIYIRLTYRLDLAAFLLRFPEHPPKGWHCQKKHLNEVENITR